MKLEGGERSHRQIELLVESGIPVMAHIGLTPQSVNSMGYRVQGRGEEAAQQLLRDAKAVQDAGAFAVVLELVPAELAAEVTRTLHIPTVGIGAGPETDAQVLVWTDMLGLTGGRVPKFVKQYANLREVMGDAAQGVRGGRRRRNVPAGRALASTEPAAPTACGTRQPAGLPPSAGCRRTRDGGSAQPGGQSAACRRSVGGL